MTPASKEHGARVQSVNRYCVRGRHLSQGVWERSGCRSGAMNIWSRRWLVPLVLTLYSLSFQNGARQCSYHFNKESPIAVEGTQALETGIHTPLPQMDLLLLTPASLIWRL